MKPAALMLLTIFATGCGPGDADNDSALQDSLPAPPQSDVAVVEPEVVTERSPIEYPVEQWDQGIEGETELMILVSDMGEVDSVMISHSSGVASFDSAALTGARLLRFSPAREGDRRIAKWIKMPIRFNRGSPSVSTPQDTSRT